MDTILDIISSSLVDETNRNKEYNKIYKYHKYWARKPWYIVEKYIKKYTEEGHLVLDPFCGSGLTGCESIINGRNFIGQDLNPISINVSRGGLISDISLTELNNAFIYIEKKCKDTILPLYKSDFICPTCKKTMYYKHVNVGPKCNSNLTGVLYCDNCKQKSIKTVLSEYDINVMNDTKNIEIKTWVPKKEFPKKFYKDRFSYKGVSKVTDLYSNRNLYALSLIKDAIEQLESEQIKELMMIAFTNTVLHGSKLKGENVRPLGVNSYWIPDDYIDENIWFRFEDRVKTLIKSKEILLNRIKEQHNKETNLGSWNVVKKSALESMGIEKYDYIFTDPPYGEAIQYSELSFVWNAWIDEYYDNKEEIIVNPVQCKGDYEFCSLLNTSLDNIYNALKKDCYFTLCFQNKSFDLWKTIIHHCKALGFKLFDVSIYDTYGSPFNKTWANFSPKSDIYVTFQKTSQVENLMFVEEKNLDEIINEVSTYMKNKGISFNNNKLYDFVVSYLIWAIYYNDNFLTEEKITVKKIIEKMQRSA